MRTYLRIALSCGLLFLVGGVYAQDTFACSCISTPIEEHFHRSSIVFLGTVIDKDGEGGNTFEVERVWKGEVQGDSLYVYGGFFGMCGIEFEEGKKYLIFTWNHEGVEKTGLCSGNMLAGEAQAEIQMLNDLANSEKRIYNTALVMIVLTMCFLAAVYWGRQRDRNAQ